MKSPLEFGEILYFDELPSTQDYAVHAVQQGLRIGGVFAYHQSEGRGRFERTWISQPGDSLTVSLVMGCQVDHSQPWILGMACAVAAAMALGVSVQWPNDLVFNQRKLGGVLSEIVMTPEGQKTLVCGLGVNLRDIQLPEGLASRATSLTAETGQFYEAREALNLILLALDGMPEPISWNELEPLWRLVDQSKGKTYIDSRGRNIVAESVGGQGQLIGRSNGELVEVFAADALFGRA